MPRSAFASAVERRLLHRSTMAWGRTGDGRRRAQASRNADHLAAAAARPAAPRPADARPPSIGRGRRDGRAPARTPARAASALQARQSGPCTRPKRRVSTRSARSCAHGSVVMASSAGTMAAVGQSEHEVEQGAAAREIGAYGSARARARRARAPAGPRGAARAGRPAPRPRGPGRRPPRGPARPSAARGRPPDRASAPPTSSRAAAASRRGSDHKRGRRRFAQPAGGRAQGGVDLFAQPRRRLRTGEEQALLQQLVGFRPARATGRAASASPGERRAEGPRARPRARGSAAGPPP